MPFGFFIPFLGWHLNVGIARAPTFSGEVLQATVFLLLCTASGWISGLIAALIYNLISKHLGIQLRGTIEGQPAPALTESADSR